jgi:hypothetical protein
MKQFTPRDKAILCGLFLSKYDNKALNTLGFTTFKEAYNVLGISIESKPASIKNYRDEFDPFFPNDRMGWHKREIRDYCAKLMNKYSNYDCSSLAGLIMQIVGTKLPPSIEKGEQDLDIGSFAKRATTGKAAENFFKENFRLEDIFKTCNLIDMTYTGCGYDFKLNDNNGRDYAVEVKGLSAEKGNILLTDKEYRIAEKMRDNYFIYIVKNFCEDPYSVLWKNPLESKVDFMKRKRQITEVTWTAVA